MREAKEMSPAPPPPAAVWSAVDASSVEGFLQLLARAVRQFHTYPPTSPLCTDAIAACHKALAQVERTDQLSFRVTPHALLVDETALGTGTLVEHELARRLYRAHVAGLEVDPAASVRDLSRFCSDLLRVHGDEGTSLADLLDEHGVETIAARMAARAEVLDLGAPRPALCGLVEHERQRHEPIPPGAPAIHLYPPGKGWVRLDPGATLGPVSLVDLAVLVEDPGEIAGMLLRLTDDEATGPDSREAALERKFSEIAMLFAALDPRLGRLMFAKLARAVLDLGPERRRSLLQQTILPGLLDGRVEGSVLQDFPDPDLAESLCLLLDLETAAPDVLAAALERLDLSPDRRQAVVPLLEAQVHTRAGTEPAPGSGELEDAIDRYARRLVQVDPAAGRSFSDLSAFDLSIDGQTSEMLARIRDEVAGTDPVAAQLDCLSRVVRLEPNPATVEKLLARTATLLADLERASRWEEVAVWLARQRQLAEQLRDHRPDVADAIDAALGVFCTRDRALHVLALAEAGDRGRRVANDLVNGYGRAAAPTWLALLTDPTVRSRERTLVQLLCEHARMLAPAFAARLGTADRGTSRAIVKVLGWAGPGYEAAIAGEFAGGDEPTIREALRALARIGTAEAATFLAAELDHENPRVRAAAEESLWHLPPERLQALVRSLVARRDFVLRQPAMAARLIDRAAHAHVEALGQAVAPLASLRFHLWRPAVARVGRQAHRLVTR